MHGTYHRLEHMAQDVAVTEAAMPIDRKRRMVRNLVIKVETAEPPIGEVQLDLLAQPPFEADAIAVPHEQHPSPFSTAVRPEGA